MNLEKKKYKAGFYGGKFMPYHKGHHYCTQLAASECEHLYLLLIINGDDELRIRADMNDPCLTVQARYCAMIKATRNMPNVTVKIVDVAKCKYPDGGEDWDAETPLILEATDGKFDAVYGSEPSYADYFKRAYPWAEYRVVDVDRSTVPISATKIRQMIKEGRKDEVSQWKI